jgi:hypothetical protein
MQSRLVVSQALLRAERADAHSVEQRVRRQASMLAGVGRALRYAKAPRPPAARPQPTVTFLNGRNSDISIWWTQIFLVDTNFWRKFSLTEKSHHCRVQAGVAFNRRGALRIPRTAETPSITRRAGRFSTPRYGKRSRTRANTLPVSTELRTFCSST